MKIKSFLAFLAVAAFAALASATAQAAVRIDLTKGNADPLPIAIMSFDGANAAAIQKGKDFRKVIANNLQNSALFNVLDEHAYLQNNEAIRTQGVAFEQWRLIRADALVTGKVQFVGNKVKVEFRLFDVYGERQIVGRSYTADASFWRHLAHRVSDDIYTALTGEGGYFTSRIVHIGEQYQGKGKKVKKLCVMDQDGGNYQCLTDGRNLVLTPHFNPQAQKIIYMSYATGRPRLYLLDLPTGRQEIIGDFEGLNSSPRFSPDGKKIAMTLTMGHAGNPEIYIMDLTNRSLKRLTNNPSIDTSPSFSPDGKYIVFNSDRSGKPSLYVMNSDGSGVRRLSYGPGRYFAPVWSPRGDLIAFVKDKGSRFSINVMDPNGEEERQLTESYMDESPTWSPNGRVIVFERQIGNRTRLYTVDLTGYNERQLSTPNDASDPAWSPLLK